MKIIVIGGGIMGLACAWRLARGGAQVELLEARRAGEGATLAALGALWPASPLASGALQRLHRESLGEFESFARQLSQESGLPVPFARLGRIELLDSAKAAARARQEAAAAEALGQAMAFLEPAQIAAAQPGLRAAAHGALLCHFTAQVFVRELVDALRAACANAGVVIRENTRVTALPDADRVLVCSGAWTALLPELMQMPVRPVKGQGLALRADVAAMPGRIIKSGPIYLIPWHERGEVLVGSTTEPEAGFDESPTPSAREALRAGAAAIMPALAHAEVLRHWAGLRPQNPAKGHLPLMGPVPGKAGLWLCTAHYKTGIGMAPLVSRLMAESMLGSGIHEKLAPFGFDAPPTPN